MAHPWLFESVPGTFVTPFGWTSETDTRGCLTVDHYTKLANLRVAPFRGAYAFHIDQSIGTVTTDAYVQEDTGFDVAADAGIFVKFYFRAKDLVMATTNRFTIFALESAAGTNEVSVSVLYTTAAGYQLVFAETGAIAIGAATRETSLILDKWHCIELAVNLDAGGGNDGDITAFVDGYQVGAAITALDQAAIVHARMGIMGGDAGTTSGHLFFNHVVADDARVYPFKERWPNSVILSQTSHVFVGPGAISNAAILTTTAGNTLHLYDTDVADGTNEQDRVVELAVGNQTSFEGPVFFQKGCYAVITGTAPRVQIMMDMDATYGEAAGPIAYGSEGAILTHAAYRKGAVASL